MSRHEIATRRVLYEIPGMHSVQVREGEFAGADGQLLPMAIYEAIAPIADPAPVVVIVAGYPDQGYRQHVGCRFMEIEWSITMARLIAASGMTAVTHSNRDPGADAIALVESFQGRRVGIWGISGSAPVALAALAHASCGVLINPVVGEDPRATKPVFVVRAGKDETAGLNAALDRFITAAIGRNEPITAVNYPEAPHAFDLFLGQPETGRILQQALDFLRAKLR